MQELRRLDPSYLTSMKEKQINAPYDWLQQSVSTFQLNIIYDLAFQSRKSTLHPQIGSLVSFPSLHVHGEITWRSALIRQLPFFD